MNNKKQEILKKALQDLKNQFTSNFFTQTQNVSIDAMTDQELASLHDKLLLEYLHSDEVKQKILNILTGS